MRIQLRWRIEPLESRIAPAFGAVFELSSLDGSNGFKLSGEAAGDSSGFSVSDAGDINGDGFADLLLGAEGADPNGSNSGAAYLVFGRPGGFGPNVNLSSLDGSNGFRIAGVLAQDQAGRSVSGAGDVNGDGFADLLIGAPFADPNGAESGAAYVVFGKGSGFAAELNLSSLDGANGFTIGGGAAADSAGFAVSGAGDINGDGFADVLIGARFANFNGPFSGGAAVVFGKAAGFSANVNIADLNGTDGFKINGAAANDEVGYAVDGAGDINGDGFADLLVSTPFTAPNGPRSGTTYVIFGKASGFSTDFNLSSLDGANGFTIGGAAAGDDAGFAVSGAGDINGDGITDLLVGALSADPNGDNSGAAYVIFGRASGFAPSLSLSMLDGANGFKISGVAAQDRAGYAVSRTGDLNGDGLADLLIGAARADPNGSDSGAAYVVYGKRDSFSANLNLSRLDGTNGFKINGVSPDDRAGAAVSAAGDINGDGAADLIIGARRADSNGNYSGASYVIFGVRPSSVTYVWDGSTSSDWFTASNWTPDGIPRAIDTAILDIDSVIQLQSSTSVAVFQQSAGTFTSPASPTFTVLESLLWSGGSMAGGGTTNVSPAAKLIISGTQDKTLVQHTLRNAGTGTWIDTGRLQLSGGAVFNNQGSFEIQNDSTLEVILGGTQPSFINQGTVEKTGGSGVTTFGDLRVVNNGTFRISSGTLLLSSAGSFMQTSGATVLSGGDLSASGPLAFQGGTLGGAGTIGASVFSIGATVQPGGDKAPGALTINGDYTQGAAATLAIELGGTTPGTQHDRLVVANTATLDGVLEINSIGGFTIPDGSSFNPLTYAAVAGAFSALDSPSGVTADAAASGLTLNAQTPPAGASSMSVTDMDGDLVTLTVNKGSIPPDALTIGANGELQVIDLRSVGSKLGGATFTVDVQQAGGGDGVVNVGAIEATGMDLARIRVDGDLGQIDIGTGDPRKPALKSLLVGSLGVMGATTQPMGTQDPFSSEVTGSLGKLTVQRDVQNAIVEVSGKLGKVLIGGNLIDSNPAPLLKPGPGSIGVFLNGGIPPAGASHAGTIFAPNIGSVTVMGDVVGGEISAETQIKTVKILGKLISVDPLDPAILRVGENIAKVVINGDVQNALILAGYNRSLQPRNPDASIGKVVVKGNWTASSVVAGVADPADDGFGIGDTLIAGDATPALVSRIASVIIKGTASGSATLTDHSAVTAQKIGSLRISNEKVPLTSDLDDIVLDPLGQNFRAVEI